MLWTTKRLHLSDKYPAKTSLIKTNFLIQKLNLLVLITLFFK